MVPLHGAPANSVDPSHRTLGWAVIGDCEGETGLKFLLLLLLLYLVRLNQDQTSSGLGGLFLFPLKVGLYKSLIAAKDSRINCNQTGFHSCNSSVERILLFCGLDYLALVLREVRHTNIFGIFDIRAVRRHLLLRKGPLLVEIPWCLALIRVNVVVCLPRDGIASLDRHVPVVEINHA